MARHPIPDGDVHLIAHERGHRLTERRFRHDEHRVQALGCDEPIRVMGIVGPPHPHDPHRDLRSLAAPSSRLSRSIGDEGFPRPKSRLARHPLADHHLDHVRSLAGHAGPPALHEGDVLLQARRVGQVGPGQRTAGAIVEGIIAGKQSELGRPDVANGGQHGQVQRRRRIVHQVSIHAIQALDIERSLQRAQVGEHERKGEPGRLDAIPVHRQAVLERPQRRRVGIDGHRAGDSDSHGQTEQHGQAEPLVIQQPSQRIADHSQDAHSPTAAPWHARVLSQLFPRANIIPPSRGSVPAPPAVALDPARGTAGAGLVAASPSG